jgi:hypothetical protein
MEQLCVQATVQPMLGHHHDARSTFTATFMLPTAAVDNNDDDDWTESALADLRMTTASTTDTACPPGTTPRSWSGPIDTAHKERDRSALSSHLPHHHHTT